MEMKWTYLLILVIYGVLGLLHLLNHKIDKQFKDKYPTAKVYKGHRRDFFEAVAVITVVIALVINALSVMGGQGMNTHTLIISLLVVGMTFFTKNITLTIAETALSISGFTFDCDKVKSFKQIEKKGKIKNSIVFVEAINGYEGIEFLTESPAADALKHLLS